MVMMSAFCADKESVKSKASDTRTIFSMADVKPVKLKGLRKPRPFTLLLISFLLYQDF